MYNIHTIVRIKYNSGRGYFKRKLPKCSKKYKMQDKLKESQKGAGFRVDFFDLIVWFENDNEITGFQLCYNILLTKGD